MTEPDAPPESPRASSDARGRKELQLDPALQARMLAQMHEEQAAALRKRELTNWVLTPLVGFLLLIGTVLMFSDNLMIAFAANTVATGIAWVLWKVNRARIRDFLGM